MTQNCCIYMCKSGDSPESTAEVSFYAFPEDLDQRMEWMKVISCKKAWSPPVKDIESLRVCSLHFVAKDFATKGGQTFLKTKAVPSVFLKTGPPLRLAPDGSTINKRPTTIPASSASSPKKACIDGQSAKSQPTEAQQTKPQDSKYVYAKMPHPQNVKRVYFTDKSGNKLLLLTTPITPAVKKPAANVITSDSQASLPAVEQEAQPQTQTSVSPAEAIFSEVDSTPSTSKSSEVTDISFVDETERKPNSQTTSLEPISKEASPVVKKGAITPRRFQCGKMNWAKPSQSNSQERVTELKILQEMSLMKRELLKKTLQLTQMKNLVEKLKKERAIGSVKKANALMKSVRSLQEKADSGDTAAVFLMEQISAMDRNPRYSDSTIQQCALWRNASAEGYEFVRRTNLMSLPSSTTLIKCSNQKETGNGNGANANNNGDLQKRLQKQLAKMTEVQKVGSLIVHGICSPETKPVKELVKPETPEEDDDDPGHYVTYQFVGLDLPEFVSLGRHYLKSASMDGDTLKCLTVRTCEDAERVGLKIMRIIGDASLETIAMFGLIGDCGGPAVSPQVMNPVSPTRPLYLTCDYVDVARRLRAQFVEDNQRLVNAGRPISRLFVRRLYGVKMDEMDASTALQLPPNKSTLGKLGRCSKLLFVVNIFSPTITKSMRSLMERVDGLKNADKTIEFLEMMYAWCVVQDICNSSPEVVPDGLSIEDKFLHAALLEWLEEDFLGYLENWRQSCATPDNQFLSATNYSALRLTTLAAVLYVRYLLESKFHLTNPKNFDEQIVNSVVSDIIDRKKTRHLDPETITLVSGDDDVSPIIVHHYEGEMAASILEEMTSPEIYFLNAAEC